MFGLWVLLLAMKWNASIRDLFFVEVVSMCFNLKTLNLSVYERYVNYFICSASGIHTEAVVHVQLSFKWNMGRHWKQTAAARSQRDCRLGDHRISQFAVHWAGMLHMNIHIFLTHITRRSWRFLKQAQFPPPLICPPYPDSHTNNSFPVVKTLTGPPQSYTNIILDIVHCLRYI